MIIALTKSLHVSPYRLIHLSFSSLIAFLHLLMNDKPCLSVWISTLGGLLLSFLHLLRLLSFHQQIYRQVYRKHPLFLLLVNSLYLLFSYKLFYFLLFLTFSTILLIFLKSD